jgi:hypothetical protein
MTRNSYDLPAIPPGEGVSISRKDCKTFGGISECGVQDAHHHHHNRRRVASPRTWGMVSPAGGSRKETHAYWGVLDNIDYHPDGGSLERCSYGRPEAAGVRH